MRRLQDTLTSGILFLVGCDSINNIKKVDLFFYADQIRTHTYSSGNTRSYTKET